MSQRQKHVLTVALGLTLLSCRTRQLASSGSFGPSSVGIAPAEIQNALQARDPIEREVAAQRAVPLAAAALPAVIDALQHGDGPTRWNATYILTLMGPAAADAVPALIGTLQDRDPEIRSAAALALGEIGPVSEEVVVVLAGTLTDEDSLPRSAATVALGRIGPRATVAVPALVSTLDDPSVGVADGAAEALARVGPTAVPDLVSALNTAAAKSARQRYLPATVPQFASWRSWDHYWAICERAARAVGEIGPAAASAIPALIQCLRTQSEEARHALVRIGSAAIPPLIEALQDDHVQVNAANTLADVGAAGEGAVAALVALLRRGWTSYALGRIGPTAAPPLIKALRDPDAAARAAAVDALAGMAPPATAALPALIAALHDPNENVRAHATRAVGHTAAPRLAVHNLMGPLRDRSTLVRQWAVDTLQRIGPPARDAVPILEAMQENDPDMETYAAAALLAIVPAPAARASPAAEYSRVDLRYRIVVGDHAAPAASGHVWLYAVRWFSLTRRELASIADGRTHIELTLDSLAHGWSGKDYDREGEPASYIIAIELAGNQWHRTHNFKANALWNQLPQLLNDLGVATPRAEETLLRLPSPAAHRVGFMYPNGRPMVDVTVPVSLDFAELGRCAVHEGVPIGTFRTDATGAIAFRGPLLPLHLDIGYLTTTETGRYCHRENGIDIGPGVDVVLQEVWQLDAPERDFTLTVRTAGGAPVAGADIVHTLCVVTSCGVADWGTLATTDDRGVARLRFIPETTRGLRLDKGGEERELSEDELTQLFAAGQLALTW